MFVGVESEELVYVLMKKVCVCDECDDGVCDGVMGG